MRLSALLLVLGLAVLALLSSDGLAGAGSGTAAQTSRVCVHPRPPRLARSELRGIIRLRAGLLPVMAPLALYRYQSGIVYPEAIWSDESPQRLASSVSAGSWPASFEMRSWAVDPERTGRYDDVAADAFEFEEPSEARQFLADASSAHCRSRGEAHPVSQPAGSSNLVWLNPDRAMEYDVFMLRGSRMYRLVEVRSQEHPLAREERLLFARIDRLACGLPKAGCQAAG
jgi:hypothetical protein